MQVEFSLCRPPKSQILELTPSFHLDIAPLLRIIGLIYSTFHPEFVNHVAVLQMLGQEFLRLSCVIILPVVSYAINLSDLLRYSREVLMQAHYS